MSLYFKAFCRHECYNYAMQSAIKKQQKQGVVLYDSAVEANGAIRGRYGLGLMVYQKPGGRRWLEGGNAEALRIISWRLFKTGCTSLCVR